MLSKKRKRLQRLARTQSRSVAIPKVDALDELRLELQAQCEILEISRKNPKWASGPICQQARPNTRLTKPGSRAVKGEPVLMMDKRQDLQQGPKPFVVPPAQPAHSQLPALRKIAKSRKRKSVSDFVPFSFNGGGPTP